MSLFNLTRKDWASFAIPVFSGFPSLTARRPSALGSVPWKASRNILERARVPPTVTFFSYHRLVKFSFEVIKTDGLFKVEKSHVDLMVLKAATK